MLAWQSTGGQHCDRTEHFPLFGEARMGDAKVLAGVSKLIRVSYSGASRLLSSGLEQKASEERQAASQWPLGNPLGTRKEGQLGLSEGEGNAPWDTLDRPFSEQVYQGSDLSQATADRSTLEGSAQGAGDAAQQETGPSRKGAVLVDGVILNGPTTDVKAGEKFVEEAWRLIMEEVVLKATDVSEKVCEWRPPEQLRQLLDLEPRDSGEPHGRLLALCRDVIRYSVKTSKTSQALPLPVPLPQNHYTYEVSPVFLLVEEAVLKKMIEFIGWKEGDGIFNPGGSVSNMYAMNLARYKFCPDIKEKGLSGLPRLILFTSAECHYSMKKAASFLGIGTENVCFVETDESDKQTGLRGLPLALAACLPILFLLILEKSDAADGGGPRASPREGAWNHTEGPCAIAVEGIDCVPGAPTEQERLRKKTRGAAPFLVCATAGTTVLGAFDPLDEIADVCEQHGLWLHVDVSAPKADSVAWNPHKMLMAGIQCCAFLVKDRSDLLKKCYSAKASYLFQQDKFYDVSYDTGDKSIQCSRRPDAFKFWMTWKALGTLGLEERVNRALALSRNGDQSSPAFCPPAP
ncbi:hypothetical protein CB1_000571010 [Camelus ferus]|nr:hypothetical protein CB1_000571010 [Camelus ferus]